MSMLNRPLRFNDGHLSFGVIECFLSTLIFFSPNFLLYFEAIRSKIWVFLLYDFVILYLLVSVLAHKRFKKVNTP